MLIFLKYFYSILVKEHIYLIILRLSYINYCQLNQFFLLSACCLEIVKLYFDKKNLNCLKIYDIRHFKALY